MENLYPVSCAIIHQTVSVFGIFILYVEYSVTILIRFLEYCEIKFTMFITFKCTVHQLDFYFNAGIFLETY